MKICIGYLLYGWHIILVLFEFQAPKFFSNLKYFCAKTLVHIVQEVHTENSDGVKHKFGDAQGMRFTTSSISTRAVIIKTL